MAKRKTEENGVKAVTLNIPQPNLATVGFKLIGSAPYVSNNFGGEARQMMHDTQAAGETARKGKKRKPKDFEKGFQESLHRTKDGKYGMPANGFRAAMISACRTVGFQMTRAKLAVFVEADDYDVVDGTPLVVFTKGEPRYVEHFVRNDDGSADIRPRGMFDPGWEALIRVTYDADMFTLADVTNLLSRVGLQVGVGAGRPDSKKSAGMGWGRFRIEEGNGKP